jgi:hypothetical protein
MVTVGRWAGVMDHTIEKWIEVIQVAASEATSRPRLSRTVAANHD